MMRNILRARPALGVALVLALLPWNVATSFAMATAESPAPLRKITRNIERKDRQATTAPSESASEAIGLSEPKSPLQWYTQGLALVRTGEWVEARAYLSTALCSEQLTAAQESRAAGELSELAEKLLFGVEVFPHDPVAYRYVVKERRTIKQIVRQERLRVPPELIAQINSLPDGAVPGAGLELKLVRGPVHVLVHKHSFALDLYVLDDEGRRLILKRVAVALGKQDSTPTGQYVVGPKVRNPSWSPPPDSKFADRGTIQWGEPDYPFGPEAYWIGLNAMSASGGPAPSGLGLHSTSDQSSIGKRRSMGCIRIGKADIPTIYKLLSTGASMVQIDP